MGVSKLGDGKDRWWTGGGFIELGEDIHPDSSYTYRLRPNKVRLQFDRFTWANEAGYHSATKAGLPYIPITDANRLAAHANSGQYALVFSYGPSHLHFGASNHFKDVQDMLHDLADYAKHPTLLPPSWFWQYQHLLN